MSSELFFFQCTWVRKWIITLCTREWFFSRMSSVVGLQMSFLRKNLSHCVQGNSFSPGWLLMWVFRCASWENTLPRCVQEYGFSPEWVLITAGQASYGVFRRAMDTWFIIIFDKDTIVNITYQGPSQKVTPFFPLIKVTPPSLEEIFSL